MGWIAASAWVGKTGTSRSSLSAGGGRETGKRERERRRVRDTGHLVMDEYRADGSEGDGWGCTGKDNRSNTHIWLIYGKKRAENRARRRWEGVKTRLYRQQGWQTSNQRCEPERVNRGITAASPHIEFWRRRRIYVQKRCLLWCPPWTIFITMAPVKIQAMLVAVLCCGAEFAASDLAEGEPPSIRTSFVVFI